MRVLSLFDGISCGRVALDRAGFAVDDYAAFEIDRFAVQTSQKNYPDIRRFGNVFDGNFTQFEGYDLLLGGSPCTYWSIAKRNRETTCDGEGFKLFMQYVRALKEAQPRYFLYENNYSIHQNIKDEISAKLGVQPILINSALVSAQQRKRTSSGTLGYDLEGDSLKINLAEAEVVRYIFNKFIEHKSLSAVAELCTIKGYCGKRGQPFKAESIKKILTRHIYVGFNTYKGKLYKGDFPSLIEDKTFNKAQKILAAQARQYHKKL